MPVQSKIQLYVDGQKFDIDAGCTLFLFYESLFGIGVFRYRADTLLVDLWEQIIKSGDDVVLKLRWGVIGEGGTEETTSWRRVRALKIRIRYDVDSPSAWVDVSGMDYGSQLLSHSSLGAYPQEKVSAVVKAIASRNDLRSSIAETESPGNYWQTGRSDASFIVKDLLPFAVGTDGRADYNFYIVGDKLIFEPPNLQQEPVMFVTDRNRIPEGGETVLSTELVYDRWHGEQVGALKAEGRGFDPLTKEVVPRSTEFDDPQLGRQEPRVTQSIVQHILLPLPRLDRPGLGEVAEWLAVRWGQAHRQLFRTEVRVMIPQVAKLGGVANLAIESEEGASRLGGGLYLISEFLHEIRVGSYTGTLSLARWGLP